MKRVIGFTKTRWLTYTLSSLVIVAMFVLTFTINKGFTLGIDFEPGVAVQIAVDKSVPVHIDQVRASLSDLSHVQVQNFGGSDSQEYNIRVRAFEDTPNYATDTGARIRNALATKFGQDKVTVLQTTSVGPRYSASLTQQAFLLVGAALLLIGIYIWIRFRLGFALAAIVSTVHNILFMIGFIGLVRMEITSSTIAAVLTIVGYCLNDTIVVFDRIRENEKLMETQKLSFIYDSSITQTLSRTIVTAFTVLLSVFAIWFFTNGEIKDFASVLLVGVAVGTYSSIFIASPVLLDYRTSEAKRRRIYEAKLGGTPVDVAREQAEAEQTAGAVGAGEIDADALADNLRRARQEKKKF